MKKLELFGIHPVVAGKHSIVNESEFTHIVSSEEDLRGGFVHKDRLYCAHLLSGEEKWFIDDSDDNIITICGSPTSRIIAKFRETDESEFNEIFEEVWEFFE